MKNDKFVNTRTKYLVLMMKKSVFSLLVLSILLHTVILAQEASNKDTTTANKLEEVVISANKSVVPKQDIIQQI